MSYCTLANLQTRYGDASILQLADPWRAGIIDETITDAAIAAADAEIDAAFAAAGYDTPVTWGVLQEHGEAIAYWHLFPGNHKDEPKPDYDKAQAFLQLVRQGEITPPGVEPIGPTPAGEPQIDAPDRIFTGDTLSDF
jgi:phage gp36-like protein